MRVFGQLDTIPTYLRLWRLEILLVRPMPLLLQLITADFHIRQLARLAVGVLIIVIFHPGEAVGYIGANGAGKSTTIKMLTGILVPTSGRVRTCGYDPVPQRRQLAREIGVVFGQRSQLWWDLPLRDSFRILGAIHRLPTVEATARTEQLVDHLGLADLLDTPVRQLSLGERMRGEVAAALVGPPPPATGTGRAGHRSGHDQQDRLRHFLVAGPSSIPRCC
jgi:ABC-2 type transport system ATP-binding protein